MPSIKDKTKILFSFFLTPREIIFLVTLVFISFFFLFTFLYQASNLLMVDRIMYKGGVTEGVIGSPKNTNPYKADSQVDKDLNRLLYSSLIKNLDGDKFELGLAKSLDVTSDRKVYKLALRDNIYFSNGTPITLDDVIFSLGQVPLERNFNVEKSGENSLTFTLRKEDPAFLLNLTYPIISKNEVFENNFSMNLVTSSFFRIKSISKDVDGNVTSIVLKRYNNGEEKLPYLKTYTIKYFKTDVEAYNAFQRKEIDLLSGINGTTLSKIVDDKKIKLEVAQLPNNFAVFLNQNGNVDLRDSTLRKALSDIVDRESLVNQVLGGFGTPQKNILGEKGSTTQATQIINNLTRSGFSFENGVLYTSTKKTTQNKSDDKSDENSDKKTLNNGATPVKITITTIQNSELIETANFLKNSWKKIGVDTEVRVIDRKDLNSVVKDRDFEALLFGYSIREPKDYYSFFSSKERTYPKLNISNYTSKQTDKILDVLIDEAEPNRILDLTNQLSVEVENDNPVLILYKPQFVFAHFLTHQIELPNRMKDEQDRYREVENWYTNTEKVFKIFRNVYFVDILDTYLY